jgi:signal transduction histidine kinase
MTNEQMPSISTNISQGILAAIDWLVRPNRRIQDKADRERAQLLSSLLLTTFVVVALIIVYAVHLDPEDIAEPSTIGGIILLSLCIFLYGLNRAGYTRWAAGGLIVYLLAIFFITPYTGTRPEMLAFAMVPVLLTGMFFSLRWATGVVVLIIGTVFVLNSLQVDEYVWARRLLWYFLCFAGALVLAFMYHLNRLEVIRRAALEDANAQLRASEAQLADYQKYLEKMVAERTAQLQEKADELEAFSYSVSHDLRAPLRAMDGFSKTLMEKYHDNLPDQAQHYLSRIRDNAGYMGQLINDLLALSHVGRREMRFLDVDPNRLVADVIEELGNNDQLGSAQVRVDNLPPCRADPALLRLVYLNLISNGLKYSRERERPVIHVGFETDQDQRIRYFVRDNGVGFDMQYADKLFGVFQRLHDPGKYEGTGIGLATVQRIIHRHNGRVWAQAEPDHGATFYFSLSS